MSELLLNQQKYANKEQVSDSDSVCESNGSNVLGKQRANKIQYLANKPNIIQLRVVVQFQLLTQLGNNWISLKEQKAKSNITK